MTRHQIKSVAAISAISLVTMLGYQNCTNMKFAETASEELSSLSPSLPQQVDVADPAQPTQPEPQVNPSPTPGPNVAKISCTAVAEPSGKPTGFVYSSSSNSCVPSSGTGPSYRFRITCDSALPSDPVGIRIQYNINYFSQITNATYFLQNTTNYYRGRSFYKRVYAPPQTPAAALATVYGLTNISRASANSVVVQSSFFFLDGHPMDSVSRDCNNVRNWDLGLYIYIDKNGAPELFNTDAARVNLL